MKRMQTRDSLSFCMLLLSLWATWSGVVWCGNADYRLGSGDVISVKVFEYPDLATEARVSQRGNITFPLVGEVKVGDLSVNEAERTIAQRLDKGGYIHHPQVTLIVLSFQSQKVLVMGQVNTPGRYALEDASTVMDLLALAGGIAHQTAAENATLVHKDGDKENIDLHALFDGDAAQNRFVRGGDSIYVPRAPQFYIYGEVQRPGVYRLERNMSVAQAISAGGGLTPRGMQWFPYIKRRGVDGKEQEIDVESSDLLQADDVLYVRESWF